MVMIHSGGRLKRTFINFSSVGFHMESPLTFAKASATVDG